MSTPYSMLWPLKRHTQAKHEVLIGYFEAWLPQVGMYNEHVLIVDGFAGPGEYSGNEPGSPILLLDSYCDHAYRNRIRATPHFRFIESDPKRAEHLRNLIENNPRYADVDVRVISGDFSVEFPQLLDRAKGAFPEMPIFAFVDPFGAGDEALHLAANLVSFAKCEALLYVPMNHLARFVGTPEVGAILEKLLAPLPWRELSDEPDLPTRRATLQSMFREKLSESCEYVRTFDISPDIGGNTYALIFGTNDLDGLAKMKTSMWKVDPVNGRSFKDTTTVDHPVLFSSEPDLGELERLLRENFEDQVFSIEDAQHFVLVDTAFRHDGHLKGTLKKIEARGGLEAVDTPPQRRKGTYSKGTKLRFL